MNSTNLQTNHALKRKHNTLNTMNLEDIKVGETYNVRVRVSRIDTNCLVCQPLNQDGTPSDFSPNYFNFAEAEAFYPAENGKKPTEPAPKYDPCRKFREGDEVRYVPCNGRECPVMPCDEYYREKTLTVVKDEDSNHQVLVRTQDGREKYIRFCYLQLITPVEELKPYYIDEYPNTCKLMKRDGGKLYKLADYWDTHPRFKAAAEAECDRLNEEWRKMQK